MRRTPVWAGLAFLLTLAAASAAPAGNGHGDKGGKGGRLSLKVLSSPASMVTGGDTLVRLTIPRSIPLTKPKCLL